MKINLDTARLHGQVKIAQDLTGHAELNSHIHDALVKIGSAVFWDAGLVDVDTSHEKIASLGEGHEKVAGLLLAAGAEVYWNNVGTCSEKVAFQVLQELHKVGELSCEIHAMKMAGHARAEELEKINNDYLVELLGKL